MAALCAGAALGVLMILQGVRGNAILPEISSIFPSGTSTAAATAWCAGAIVAAMVVVAVTRWVGAAIGVLIMTLGMPWFFGGASASKREMEKTQAIATWAEMIRDNMAGAAGLEQALMASADVAPQAIAREVRVFVNQLEIRPVAESLAVLGDELDHPAADLVVVSLANAARMEGRDLGPLLTRLAESIRADVRMRQRVEIGRARIRTSSKIVLGVTLFTIALVYMTSRDLLGVYDTVAGQFWLMGIFALFIGSLWLMNWYAEIDLPERFSARRARSRLDLGELE